MGRGQSRSQDARLRTASLEAVLATPSPPGISDPALLASYEEFSSRHLWLREQSVLTAFRGSLAHGTYVPSESEDSIDDRDIIAVCVGEAADYFSTRQWGSRGTREVMDLPWDLVAYEARKLIGMLAQANPNVLPILWTGPELWLGSSPEGALLVGNRSLFASKRALDSFRGYGFSQAKKMRQGTFEGVQASRRRQRFEKFGYDCKSASHTIRLLRQGRDFLLTGELEVVRKDAEELIAIKQGGWSLERVEREIERSLAGLESAAEKSKLPEKPDQEQIDQLSIEVVTSALRRRGDL